MAIAERGQRPPLFIIASDGELRREHLDRPLGDLSTFVAEEMPFWVSSIRRGESEVGRLRNHVEFLLSSMTPQQRDASLYDPRSQRLALADLMFARNAIGNSHGTPGSNLLDLTEKHAQRLHRPATLTYEDSVIINPRRDRRTFTDGTMGLTEADFYETHNREEDDNDQIIYLYTAAIDALASRGRDAEADAVALLKEAVPFERNTINDMRAVGMNMNPKDFAIIREYFKGYSPDKTQRLFGASGAFSATPQIIYMLLTGWLHEKTAEYLERFIEYFPSGTQSEIADAIVRCREGLTLSAVEARLGSPPLLHRAVRAAKRHQLALLQNHKKAIATQIRGALEGKVQGTGGFGSVTEFVDIKIIPLKQELAAA
ncbi:MAG TPA: hypothetical protein VJC10_02195 [Patescibacteria group bacterium]|nr:hypothetical protein [Patescibacteria group bacterium]